MYGPFTIEVAGESSVKTFRKNTMRRKKGITWAEGWGKGQCLLVCFLLNVAFLKKVE